MAAARCAACRYEQSRASNAISKNIRTRLFRETRPATLAAEPTPERCKEIAGISAPPNSGSPQRFLVHLKVRRHGGLVPPVIVQSVVVSHWRRRERIVRHIVQ